MTRHRVDPSRRGRRSPGSSTDAAAADYARGYTAGYARGAPPPPPVAGGGGGGGGPSGCRFLALMILAPLLILLPPLWPLAAFAVVTVAGSGWALGRRNPDHDPQRPVSDWLHDRTDSAEPAPRRTADSDPDGWHLGTRTGTPKE